LPVVVVGFGVVKDAGAPPMSDAILIPGGGGPGRSMGLESDQAGDTLDFTQFLINGSGRDLVLVDQRGAGLSDPALHCEEFEEAMLRYLAVDMPPEAEALLWGDASRRCARRLEAEGWTPAAFDTRSAARDLEALRGALGYSQWNLYGTSYAANLSLAYARDFPGSVRSLILESPDVPDGDVADAPGNFERVLGTLFERCERDERCRRDYPDPAGALDRVLARLDAQPLAIDVSHPRTLEAVSVLVTPVRLLDSISSALYSTHSAHELPRIVTAADRGSFDMLSQLVKEHVWSQLDSRFAIGLLAGVDASFLASWVCGECEGRAGAVLCLERGRGGPGRA
jgi:pimeloyl-ACP methyl ester carboxylesterase